MMKPKHKKRWPALVAALCALVLPVVAFAERDYSPRGTKSGWDPPVATKKVKSPAPSKDAKKTKNPPSKPGKKIKIRGGGKSKYPGGGHRVPESASTIVILGAALLGIEAFRRKLKR